MKEPYYVDHRHEQPVDTRAAWYGVAGPPIIWALHLVVAYAVAALDCYWRLFPFTVLGLAGVRFVLLILTAVAVAAIVVAAIIAYRHWRDLRHEEAREERDPTGRFHVMAFSGMFLAGYFLLFMVWSVFTIVLIERCP